MFSDRIKELRNKAMLNQKDFGATIGAALSSISKYEKGTAIPKKKVIDKICQVYGVDEAWLMGEETLSSSVEENAAEDFESVSTLEEEYCDEVEESVAVTVEEVEEELKEEAEEAIPSAEDDSESNEEAATSVNLPADEEDEPEMVDIELTDDSTLDFDVIKIESSDGKQIEMYDLLRKVKLADLDAMSVYIKPEENKAYYVTKSTTGSVDIW